MHTLDKNHQPLSMFMTFVYSLAAHIGILLFLVILSFIPLEKRKRPIVWLNPKVRVLTPQSAPEKKTNPDNKVGVQRRLDPENARPKPTPTPRRTPAPTPPPNDKAIVVPKETPRTLRKKSTDDKKVAVTTPTPTPTPKVQPKITPSPRKEVVATPPPTPLPTPKEVAVVTPTPLPPRPAPTVPPKGSRDGGKEEEKKNTFQIADPDVYISSSYQNDAKSRFRQNFRPPAFVRTQAKTRCVVSFKIRKDGTIYDVRTQKSTGRPNLDRFALDAVTQTAKLLPLPATVNRDHVSATITFEFGS
ncbi:MAG: TonB family protein, partial [Candidatus Sumerlaeia bacterium]